MFDFQSTRFKLADLNGTAKLNGLDPEACLRYILERIAEHANNRVRDLLLSAVAEALLAEREQRLAVSRRLSKR